VSIDAVIFDLDGVIIDSEEVWNDVRHALAEAHGGHWSDETDQAFLMGDNSMQWAARMRENNGVQLSDQEIYDGVVGGLRERYASHLPVIPGAREAIAGLAPAYRLGVASSSPRELIECALELAGLRGYFDAVVSSDEVVRGKPEPYVYWEACARLETSPDDSAAVEDSSSGLEAAFAAGLAVIAVPNPAFPPSVEAIGLADVVLDSIAGLTGALIASLGDSGGRGARRLGVR
jgi:HAD superfamily hydrolase (TIGR01509 family)